MWLVKIDLETGLVYDDPSNDGWRGVNEFMVLYKKYGIEALSVVALSVDYLSPYRRYREKDRPGRVMEEVYGDRYHLDIENDKIVSSAFRKYRTLQFQSDMQTNALNEEIRRDLIEKLTTAFEVGDDVEIDKLNKRLDKFTASQKKFNETFDVEKIIEKFGVASNGYQLTRIEIDIESRKNSKFVDTHVKFKNPNRLGLGSKGEDEKTKVVGSAGETTERKKKTTRKAKKK